MYVDVEKNYDKKYGFITIYKDDIAEKITTNCHMKYIAEHIKSIVTKTKENVYIDTRGYGLLLADCLSDINVKYIPLKIEKLNLMN